MASLADLVVRIHAARAGASDDPPPPSHNELTENEAIKALLEHGCAGPSALYAKLKKAGVVLARRNA